MARFSPRAALLTVLALLFLFLSIVSYVGIFEDSFIAFRYAENLAHGHGLVYNAGERVWGYSDFLWVVMLACGASLKLAIPTLSRFLGVIFGIAVIARAFRWSCTHNSQSTLVSLTAPLLLATSTHFLIAAQNGMETVFFAYLAMSGILLFIREFESGSRFPGYAIVFLLATITRPEAPLLMVTACAIELLALAFRRSKAAVRRLISGLFLYGAGFGVYTACMWLYYGYPLSNSVYLKGGIRAVPPLSLGLGYVANFFSEVRWPLLFWPCLFLLLDRKRARQNGILLAFTAAWIAFVIRVGGDYQIYFSRFMVPILPAMFLLAANGLDALLESMTVALPRWARRWVAVAAVAALVFVNLVLVRCPMAQFFSPTAVLIPVPGYNAPLVNLVGSPPPEVDRTPQLVENLLALRRSPKLAAPILRFWLSAESLDIHPMGMAGQELDRMIPRNRTVAVCQAGEIPFYLKGRRIVDLGGLMNNQVTHPSEGLTPAYLERTGIDYFALYYNETPNYYFPRTLNPEMVSSEYFQQHYRLEHVFYHTSRIQTKGLATSACILLFARRDRIAPVSMPYRGLQKDIYDAIREGRVTGLLCNLSWPDRGQFTERGLLPFGNPEMVAYFSAEETSSTRPVEPARMNFPLSLAAGRPAVRFTVEPQAEALYVGWANITADQFPPDKNVRLTVEIVDADGAVKGGTAQKLHPSGWTVLKAEAGVHSVAPGDKLVVELTAGENLSGAVAVDNLMLLRFPLPQAPAAGKSRSLSPAP